MRTLILFVFVALAFAATTPFIDMWEEIKDAACLFKDNKLVNLRVMTDVGKVDPNFAKNLAIIKKNVTDVKVGAYMVPSPKHNATKQVEQIVHALKGTEIKMVSIDVEGHKWNKEPEKNVEFLKLLIAEFNKVNIKPAIMTKPNDWTRILGKTFEELSALPLWWVHHDKDPEAKKFKPFGGWKAPAAKQYDAVTLCDNKVNKNSMYAA